MLSKRKGNILRTGEGVDRRKTKENGSISGRSEDLCQGLLIMKVGRALGVDPWVVTLRDHL